MIERLPGNVQLVIGKLEIGWKSFSSCKSRSMKLESWRVKGSKIRSQLTFPLTLTWPLLRSHCAIWVSVARLTLVLARSVFRNEQRSNYGITIVSGGP